MTQENSSDIPQGYLIRRTDEFNVWLERLKDTQALLAILARIKRIQKEGFFGDTKGVGQNVSELRFHVGAGYRVYYTVRGNTVVFLLYGGDKSSKRQQQKDIQTAQQLCRELEHDDEN